MKPASFMIIAGDASGDELAAELVEALRVEIIRVNPSTSDAAQPLRTELMPTFFGAGGPRMKAAGVDVAFDLTQHSIIGITRALRKVLVLGPHFARLLKLAKERQPDVVIGVDYGGFNTRFGRAVKNYSRRHSGPFQSWKPKIVQFVSPQVWASRPGRAYKLAESHDLILSIFPFEREWYARRVPRLHVEFVGHPMVDRHRKLALPPQNAHANSAKHIVLLPGSRPTEIRHHLAMMLEALKIIRTRVPNLQLRMVVPNADLLEQMKQFGVPDDVKVQVGGIPDALAHADLAIAKTGTVTMECAFFQVPAVTFYRLSWVEAQIGRCIVRVKWITMPNLLADEEVYPEFIQNRATPENVAAAALEMLENESHRTAVKQKLTKIVSSLGAPGATARAAQAIVKLLR